MKKVLTIALLLMASLSWAELPSWGMTENQYKLPNFSSKMSEIGAQAAKNNWLLKITAPKDWHNKIRMGLTNSGARDVQVNFKDSLYNSIAISAAPGIKMAQVSSSGDGETATVQKQVVIDKPEIDTEIEAPQFGKIEIESNGDELLEEINSLEITVPAVGNGQSQSAAKPASQPAANVQAQNTGGQIATTPQLSAADQAEAAREENKEDLRKRHARTKRVDKQLSYASINSKDELFIQGDVVLIKRFINRGVVLYFWMKEAYDPTLHKLVEKGSGKYEKDPEAVAGDQVTADEEAEVVEEIEPTNLDFVAVDTAVEDQDDLRRSHARNKRVDLSISADQLKSDDILYVLNQTVLVERPITSAQSAYFWLVGDTTINLEVERKGDNQFEIQ